MLCSQIEPTGFEPRVFPMWHKYRGNPKNLAAKEDGAILQAVVTWMKEEIWVAVVLSVDSAIYACVVLFEAGNRRWEHCVDWCFVDINFLGLLCLSWHDNSWHNLSPIHRRIVQIKIDDTWKVYFDCPSPLFSFNWLKWWGFWDE